MKKNRKKIILLLLAVAVIILSVLLSVTIYSYHQITDDINARKVYLNGNLSHINSAQGNLFYRDFIAFSATKPTLNGLRSLRQELDENFAAKIFYRSESNRKISQIEQVLLRYERKMDIIDEILEVYKDDIALVEQHSSETRALVRKATGGINENTDVADYRSLLNEINQLEVRLGNAEKSINAKRGGNGHDTNAQLENKFVHVLETAVRGDSESLGRLKSEIEKLTNTLQTVRANHAIIIRDFHSRTGLVNIVVNNLQPVTNNLGNWIRPVQNNIRTLEQNIMPGVSGLSMIRSIDPMTYQAIILIRDTNNAILRLDNEMKDLVRNVISMQNISQRYQSQQNRSNQRDFVRQAAQTRNYLNGKITLFDPTIDNLNRALDQIANYQRAVSGIRNRTVSNMLHQIGSQSSTTMNNIMGPMRDYRDNVNKMISDLDRVAEIERTYDSILSNVTSFQYANRAATDAVLPKTLTIQKSGNHLRPLILINSLGLMLLGIIVFLFMRQRDDGTGNKDLRSGAKKEEYSGKETPSPDQPSVKDYPEEIKEEVAVGEGFGEKEEFAEDAGGDGEIVKTVDEDNRFSESFMDDAEIAQSAVVDDQITESDKEDDRAGEVSMDDGATDETEKEETDLQTEPPSTSVAAASYPDNKEIGWGRDEDPKQGSLDKDREKYGEIHTQSQDTVNVEIDQSADEKAHTDASLYGFNEMIPGYLLILNGLHKGRKLALHGKRTGTRLSLTIGRDVPEWRRHVDQNKQDVHLRIADESRTLSRLQAEITYEAGKCYIRNLSNTNPTLINGLGLYGNQSAILEHKSIITAGNVQLQYNL